MPSDAPQNPSDRTLPEAAAPQDGGPIPLGGLRAVGPNAAVRIQVPQTGEAAAPAAASASGQDATEEGVDPTSFYAQVGGEPFFHALTKAFYERVAEDELLHPMYPEEDLGPAEERLRLFLMQYFGGPTTYSERRGHPRLRMRHVPFRVDRAAREAWLRCMRGAMDEVGPSPLHDGIMWDYFERAATAMINTAD